MNKCPEHPEIEPILNIHAGELTCPLCGIVLKERLVDESPEWRAPPMSDISVSDASRVGEPHNFYRDHCDLSTIIGSISFNCHHQYITSNANRKLLSSISRVRKARRDIETITERLCLPGMIADQSEHIFRLVHGSPALRRTRRGVIVAACMYTACQDEEVSRAEKLGIARHHRPAGTASGCVYMAAAAFGIKKRHDEVAELAGVAASTVQSIYLELLREAKELYKKAPVEIPVAPHRLPLN
ncbi:hypothetical protein ACOME3_005510 [Neoechinorhynchus agilis]